MYIDGNSVIFPKHKFIFYRNFGRSYQNRTIINARRKLKQYYTKSQQNDIIRYLREHKYIVE